MAKQHWRSTGRRALSVLLALMMVVGLLGTAFAVKGEADDPWQLGDVAYTATRDTRPTGVIPAGTKWEYQGEQRTCNQETHTHSERRCGREWLCGQEEHKHSDPCKSWRCGKEEHTHSLFGCIWGLTCGKEAHTHDDDSCGYDLTCGKSAHTHDESTCDFQWSCGKEAHAHIGTCYEHKWKLVRNNDKAEHLDIQIQLTATYTKNGKNYTANVELTEEDYYKERLTITSPGMVHSISGISRDPAISSQMRFNGTFPVGTSENPVQYTITLTKDVAFNVEGTTVTLPMTFQRTVHYWDRDNTCESLRETSGYKNGDWAKGNFVGGSMDFELGVGASAQPTEATLTIQKKVLGVTLTADKAYEFGVYKGTDKVATVNVTVPAGRTEAMGTVVLPLNETYTVQEEGAPDIAGYDLTTTVDGKAGSTSDEFQLTGDRSVAFTNTYRQTPTYSYTVKAEYYTNGSKDGEKTIATVNDVSSLPDADAVANSYKADNATYDSKSYEYKTISQSDTVYILRYERTVETYSYTVKAEYYTNGIKDGEASLGGDSGVLSLPTTEEVAGVYKDSNGGYNGNTYTYTSISKDGTVYILQYDRTVETYSYTVKAEYYTNGIKDGVADLGGESGVLSLPDADTVANSYKAGNTMYGSKSYEYKSVTQKDNVYTLRYERTEEKPQPIPDPVPVTYTLTVKHVDESGAALTDPVVKFGQPEGGVYTTSKKSFEGYTFLRTEGDAVFGIMNRDKTVTYVYRKDAAVEPEPIPEPDTYTLTVNYVDEDGKALAEQVVESGKTAGSEYTAAQKTIEGYTFLKNEGDAVSGTMDGDKTVTFVYRKDAEVDPQPEPTPKPDTYTLTVNFVDENGNALAEPIVETGRPSGSGYAAAPKEIEGYQVKTTSGDAANGTMDGDKTVTYVYQKKAEDIPTADVPQTGDLSALWMAMTGISAAGLIGLGVTRKKKDEE